MMVTVMFVNFDVGIADSVATDGVAVVVVTVLRRCHFWRLCLLHIH